MDHDRARALLDQQFAEEVLAPHQSEALVLHLRGCAPCRARYDRLVELEQGLAGGAPVARVEVARLLARGLPQTAEAPRRSWVRPAIGGGVAALLAAAAAALLFTRVSLPTPSSDPETSGLAVRGAAPTGTLAWVRVFQKTRGAVSPIGRAVEPGSGFLFAYTNLRDSGLRYLLIAGRDARGRLHWYHPAYESESEDPRSITIEEGTADRELAEVVYGEHPPGPLEICAVFSDRPLRVRDLDAQIERTGRWPEGLWRDCHRVNVGGPR